MNNEDESKKLNVILDLYKIFDSRRDSRIWFLDELESNSYEEYHQKYMGLFTEKSHFMTVCSFFELSGALVSRGLVDTDLYFEIFNPCPFWEKAKPIVDGMRQKRPHAYENFESLSLKRGLWAEKRQQKHG
jgi:hypothetical protein